MTGGQFLNAVALGQITPGPVVQTVAVVGYAAAGIAGALLAAAVAFAPSFAFILLGASRFDRLRGNQRVSAFLGGAGPAAIGAILGSAIPLARALTQPWQYAVLAGAGVLLLLPRRIGLQDLAVEDHAADAAHLHAHAGEGPVRASWPHLVLGGGPVAVLLGPAWPGQRVPDLQRRRPDENAVGLHGAGLHGAGLHGAGLHGQQGLGRASHVVSFAQRRGSRRWSPIPRRVDR